MRYALILVATVTALGIAALAQAAPPVSGVTIAAKPRVVVYGSQGTLFGVVVPAQASEKVTVLTTPCEDSAIPLAKSTPALTTETTATGTWNVSVSPSVSTDYAARVKNMTSTPIRVGVRPQVTLTKLGAHRFAAKVVAARSFVGKRALFQRFRPARGTWATLRKVTLKSSQTTATAGVVSSASFRSGVRAGKRVRLVLPKSQVGSCYLQGRSAPIIS